MGCVPECPCQRRYGPALPKPMTKAEWREWQAKIAELVQEKLRRSPERKPRR